MHHPFIKIILIVLTACGAGIAADRPNILWLVSEDNTTLLGCYGDPLARTPALDKLASEGVLFERCFAQPVCAPSRFTLITGTFAVSSGPANHMRAQGKIPAEIQGFPSMMRQAGYHTSNSSKTDYNADIDLSKTWNQNGKTAHYRGRSDPKQPFFSVFNHEVTHESCLFPQKDVALDFAPTDPAKVRIPPYQPDTPEIRADWARYYDHLALLDQQIARRLKDLEQSGLAEDTIIFYYGDNGGVLPRSKRFLQQSGTHVPLIMYFPPKWRHLAPAAPGSRLKQPVSFVDFAPTVLSLAGVKIPAHMPGRPFAGTQPGKNEFVFCTRDRMDERYDMIRSVVDSRWLYIRNYRPDLPYVQPLHYMFQARGYQSWARLAREGKLTPATSQFWGEKPTEELYDTLADPHNVHNLAADSTQRENLDRMRAALRQHTLETVDNGFLPEGSALEGYQASRVADAYPVARVFDLANLASERNPENLTQLIAALDDPSEPVRWWAAQGCAMLREKAGSAEIALRRCLEDPSGAVQVAAAEALVRLGKSDAAMPVLERWLEEKNHPWFSLQAANVLDRLGEGARPTLPTIMRVLAGKNEPYLTRILEHISTGLEGKSTRSGAKHSPETGSRAENNPKDLRLKPDPNLPNVLLLGDSISIGYTLPVRALLQGKANVFRPLNADGSAENCSDSGKGLAELERWLAIQPKWDVIHFNWGLHDLKHMKTNTPKPTPSADPNDPPLFTVAQYRENMEKIVARLRQTGARLIFATTTPVPNGSENPFRDPKDPPRYNAAAIEVMQTQGIRVNDLYSFVQPRAGKLQLPKNVHFNDKGSSALARQVAAAINTELAAKPE